MSIGEIGDRTDIGEAGVIGDVAVGEPETGEEGAVNTGEVVPVPVLESVPVLAVLRWDGDVSMAEGKGKPFCVGRVMVSPEADV